jgi:hypothetical protein
VLGFKRHAPQRDAGATLDLYCPRCRLSITPRAHWLAIEHCPRCVARTRTLVTLLPSDASARVDVVLPRSPERADRKRLKTTQDTRRRTWQRRRGKATRDRDSRRLSRAVDAQRRMNAPQADSTARKRSVSVQATSYASMMQLHDSEDLPVLHSNEQRSADAQN